MKETSLGKDIRSLINMIGVRKTVLKNSFKKFFRNLCIRNIEKLFKLVRK